MSENRQPDRRPTPSEGGSPPRRMRCPTTALPGGLKGCGHAFMQVPDHEGLVDCPACGIWFPAAEGEIAEHAPEPLGGA